MTIRFVIADDNKFFREAMCSLLESLDLNYELVGEAEDGNSALVVLERCVPDLLILDLRMPKLDGFGVMQHARNKYPTLKILVMSLYDSDDSKEKALKSGADAFCSKACGKAELFESLERTMAGHVNLSAP